MWAVPKEAWPGARRVGLRAAGTGRGGLGRRVEAQCLRGGNHRAGDDALLVAHTTGGRALHHTHTHTHTRIHTDS